MVRVLITEPVHGDAVALLRAAEHDVMQVGPDGEFGALIGHAAALLVRTAPVSSGLIAAAPHLKLIAKHGVGVDNIDLAAARAAGIVVANTPGANAASVAEHTALLMLATARHLPLLSVARAPDAGASIADLSGLRLLIVGYGHTGRRVAALGAAFGMLVRVHSPNLTGTLTPEGHAVAPDLDTALADADVLTLHCPLNDQTRGLIGAAALARLPRGAIVINTARGGLMDEAALAQAIRSGHLGGAGLDALAHEPIRADEPLRHVPRCILTPHVAAMGAGAFRAMGLAAATNILDHFGEGLDACAVVLPAAGASTA